MRKSASPTAITRRSGAQITGSRPKGPIGMALTPARVATRRQERFAERMTGEALLEEDPAQIGMIVDVDHEHVVKDRDARLIAELRRDVRPDRREVDRRPGCGQYQLSASFFHA